MTQIFWFCEQTKSQSTGKVKIKRMRKTKAGDDGVISLDSLNNFLDAFDKKTITEKEVEALPENVDIFGAGDQCPSMIIKQGGKFVCIPYNEAYKRTRTRVRTKRKPRGTKPKTKVYNVHQVMATHKKPVGNPKNRTFVEEPITSVDDRVLKKVRGYISLFVSGQNRALATAEKKGKAVFDSDGNRLRGRDNLLINIEGAKGWTDKHTQKVNAYVETEDFPPELIKVVDGIEADDAPIVI